MNGALFRFLGLEVQDARQLSAARLLLRNEELLGWMVFLGMLLCAFAWWCYRWHPAHRGLSPARRRVLTGLRCALFLLLVLLLLRPVLALDIAGRIRPTLVLLLDVTRSMNTRDPRVEEADLKRAAIAQGQIKDLSQPLSPAQAAGVRSIPRTLLLKSVLHGGDLHLLRDLRRDFHLEVFTFGQALAPVEQGLPSAESWIDALPASDPATALGDAINATLERQRGQPLAGICVMTDGGNNTGADPLEAAGAAHGAGVPLFLYGIGVTAPRDVIVSDLVAPEIAFVNDKVSINVRVRGQGLGGQQAHLGLKLGEEEVAGQDLVFTGQDQNLTLTFTPRRAGVFTLAAGIPARADEISGENNSASRPLRVVDQKIKVLYVEQSPRWQFRYLQAVLLRDRRIAPSFILVDADPQLAEGEGSPYQAKFPAKKEDLFKYDLVIIGEVDPAAFSPEQMGALGEFVSRLGGSCLFIAGARFTPGAYRNTEIEKMLPVELGSGEAGPGDADSAIHLALTPLGRASPMLKLAPEENANDALWAQLPPIRWEYQPAGAKPAARVLLVDPDAARDTRDGHLPVFAAQQYGLGQVFYLGTPDTWRWRQDAGVNRYPLLWGQIVQGAALSHLLGGSRRTQLSADKQEYTVGDPVAIYARLFDENFNPVTAPEVPGTCTVQVSGSNGGGAAQPRAVTLRAVPGEPGSYRGEFIASQAGRYHFATTADAGTPLEFTAAEPSFELGETSMNEPLLRQMAALSGGRFFREEDLASLAASIHREPETVHTSVDAELWASPFYFLLMFSIATAEWILRKRWHLK